LNEMPMRDAKTTLDLTFLEMRWRALSLAADLDRIERAEGGKQLLASEPRLVELRDALKMLVQNEPGRAERVQMVFSDMTPPPARNAKDGRRETGV
jgi:hypothetical protein